MSMSWIFKAVFSSILFIKSFCWRSKFSTNRLMSRANRSSLPVGEIPYLAKNSVVALFSCRISSLICSSVLSSER